MENPLPLAASVTRPAERRGYKRIKTFEPVAMTWNQQPRRAHLLHLSRSGATVDVADPPAPGENIEVELGGMMLKARAIWRGDRRCGIEFLVQIDHDEVARIVAEVPQWT